MNKQKGALLVEALLTLPLLAMLLWGSLQMFKLSQQYGALTELSYLAARLSAMQAPVQIPLRVKAEKLGLNPLTLVTHIELKDEATGRFEATLTYPVESAALRKLWWLSGQLPVLQHASEAQAKPSR